MTDRPTRPRDRFLIFGAPTLGEDEIREVVDSLQVGWLGTGPKVARFEDAFARYKGTPNAVAVSSCTAALHLSILTLELQPGEEVITTPLTFCATANAIIHAGGIPVLADIDPVTMNVDPRQVEACITPRTRAILPVHYAGRACAMDELLQIAERYDLAVVEDCAHAIETRYRGQAAGTMGNFGCFSFYVTKNATTGEGGMVLCHRAQDAARVKGMALHGLSNDAWRRFSDEGYRHYYVVQAGFKYNMIDLEAAIGLHQLAKIEESWQRRQAIWDRYLESFAGLPVELPAPAEPDTRHALHLFTILIDQQRAGITRDEFLSAMTAENIGVGVHYLSLPEHPYYHEMFGWRPESWPEAMRVGRQTVSVPLSPGLSDEDVEDVIAAVRKVLRVA